MRFLYDSEFSGFDEACQQRLAVRHITTYSSVLGQLTIEWGKGNGCRLAHPAEAPPLG